MELCGLSQTVHCFILARRDRNRKQAKKLIFAAIKRQKENFFAKRLNEPQF